MEFNATEQNETMTAEGVPSALKFFCHLTAKLEFRPLTISSGTETPWWTEMLCCRNINAFLYWHDCSVMYSLLAELEQDVLLTPAFQACFFCLQNYFRHGHCNLMGTSWVCEFTWHLTVKCWINCLIIIGQILQFSQNWHKHRIMKQWLTRWIVSNKCTAVLITFLKLKLKLKWYWNYVRKTLQKLELKWFEKQYKQEL